MNVTRIDCSIKVALATILTALLMQPCYSQESQPFVLKPASPSSLEAALPPSVYTTGPGVSSSFEYSIPNRSTQRMATPAVPTMTPGVRNTQMLEPIPAGTSVARPSSGVPGKAQGRANGETIYIGPNGRVIQPTHVYRSGRVYRVNPQSGRAKPAKPKIDYSMAPVQPAVRPKFGTRKAPQIAKSGRVIDGAPLLRQQMVVSADRSSRKNQRRTGAGSSANKGTYVAGMGRRTAPACPSCGKPKGEVSVAARTPNRK